MGDPIINAQVDDINTTLGLIKTDLSALRPSIRRLKEAIAETYITDEIDNVAIASFDDGAESMPLRELEVAITPVQSGSGDPSPSNPRPITGWSAATVTRTGKNILIFRDDVSWGENNGILYENAGSGEVYISGTATGQSFRNLTTASAGLKDFKAGQTYRLLLFGAPDGVTLQLFVDGNTALSTRNNTYTFPESFSTAYVRIRVESGTAITGKIKISPMITVGANAVDAYEPTQPERVNFSLGQTVYGGTLDVARGKLIVTHGHVDLGNLTWTKATAEFRSSAVVTNIKTPTTQSLSASAICSEYKVLPANASGNIGVHQGYTGVAVNTDAHIWARNDDFSNTTEGGFKTLMNGVQLVYELATPIEVDVTPTEISTLYAVNNIWSDTGNIIKLVYRVDWAHYLAQE